MTESKINIPKFGSFKPKPATDEGKAKEAVIAHSRGRSDADDKDKEDRRRRHGRHRSRSREPGQGVVNAETRPPEKYGSQDIFVVDRKGDEKNLLYGSIHRYSVPPFHRCGGGSVLGLPSDMKIDRDFGDDKGIVVRNWRESKSKHREKYIFSKIQRDRPRLLKIRPEAVAEETGGQEADFVPLQAPRGKKRKRHGNVEGESSGSEHEDRDYRSIYGKIEDTQSVDDDFQYVTDSESSVSEAGRTIKMDPSIQRQNIELSRKVENSPHDIDAWLALIDHQDVLIRAQNGHRTTNAETRSTADIKLHMYEKALQNTRSLPDRERLLLGIMKEGAKIWEVKAQADRWEQISEDNIDSLVLWMSYLNFKQSTFSTFQYEEVKEVFIKRIKLLSEASNISEPANGDSLYHQLIYVLLRLTLFMRESGYAELAVATWQGLLEVNFSAPHQPFTKLDRVKFFKDFWESEVPRMGEEGALGWCHFAEQEGTTDVPDVLVDPTQDDLDNKDIFRTWASAERLRSKNLLPARTMDEVVEDDPFRVILFSDIEDYLTSLPRNPALYRSLLNAFLLFCRLPPMPPIDDEGSHGWATDAFVGSELLECESEWIKIKYMKTAHSQGTDTHAEDIDGTRTPFSVQSYSKDGKFSSHHYSCLHIKQLFAMKCLTNCPTAAAFSISPESKFKDNIWFQLGNSRERCGGDNGPLFYHWIRNSLRQLIRNYFQEDLAEYYLAFEYRNEPETIKKTARGLLKQHPACLRLYNSYAMIEWSRGNKETSNAAFAAAITMSNSMSQADLNKDSIVLWKTWIWVCLEERDNSSALQHLLSIASGSPSTDITLTPAVLLQSKHHLSSNRDFLLSSGHFRHSVIYAECM
jgi:hypothetical protein